MTVSLPIFLSSRIFANKKLISTALSLVSLTALDAYTNTVHAKPSAFSQSFRRISTFEVFQNSDIAHLTSAEIIAASSDGNTLIYTDSELAAVGLVDIEDPDAPLPLGTIPLTGEPTSVAVAGPYALVAIDTSVSFTEPSGELAVIDLEMLEVVEHFDLGGQPDSIAIDPFGNFAAIVLENQRDEDLVVDGVEGALPQLPAGSMLSMRLRGAPDHWRLRPVDLTGLADYAPEDPEPEYVDINRFGFAALTLQENNHIAIVNLHNNRVVNHFSAGTVDLNHIDVEKDGVITPTGQLTNIPREPDALTFITPWTLATANEGDLFGGSRGFSIFDVFGHTHFDSGSSFEHLAMQIGHYPEKRSGKKGTEPEGINYGRYGSQDFLFVGSERGNFVAIYECNSFCTNPQFKQVIPTGMAPEGLLPIPSRNLFVVASENDEDGMRSTISLYRLSQGRPNYPTIVSKSDESGLPLPWGALSGLAADRKNRRTLYAVEDSAYDQNRIFTINIRHRPAIISDAVRLHDQEGALLDFDLEGISQRSNGNFWVVSEGDPEEDKANLLLEVEKDGLVTNQIELPPEVQSIATKHGFEGVTSIGRGENERVFVAIQRQWEEFPDTQFARIAQYTPITGEWGFFHYPLDPVESPADGWVGLSEIVALDRDTLAVIERDNIGGPDARIKRIYSFSISGLEAAPQGSPIPVVEKTLLRDLLPVLQNTAGWTIEKTEGLAISRSGRAYLVTDNDAVDDSSGETQFIRLGRLR